MAWIGTNRSGLSTSTEALKFAGLDFEVEKRELFTHRTIKETEFEEDLKILIHYATVRKDNDAV